MFLLICEHNEIQIKGRVIKKKREKSKKKCINMLGKLKQE
jgi:hypothetical protein